MNKILLILLVFFLAGSAVAEDKIKVGVVTVLSGDLAVLGDNAVKTLEVYKKYYLQQPIEFIVEDARLSSADGLKSYQKLINIDKVDLILAACTSNATMAARQLINQNKVPVISISTGGYNIDSAGDYIFRIGNSDVLNGIQQAQYFLAQNYKRVALLAEETEYTQDIAKAFSSEFQKAGGELVYNQNFFPDNTDYRSFITNIKALKPQAVFLPTQTGSALGLYIKQWHALGGGNLPVFTSFVAAPNKNAHSIAGELINGVGYMDPVYDSDSAEFKVFLERYKDTNAGESPSVPFHAAGIVDSLNIFQNYLLKRKSEDFAAYLTKTKNYKGLMGTFSLDSEGNSDLGFKPEVIKYTK